MTSTNRDADCCSSYSKVIGVACTAKPPSWSSDRGSAGSSGHETFFGRVYA
jgi:hypothetical protein